jgi:hypothetical protein
MCVLLRICSCMFVFLQATILITTPAKSQQLPYATAVQLSGVIETLHCPSCSVAHIEAAGRYYVRTVEGLNVPFSQNADAIMAAQLLNTMIEARGHCEAETYRAALDAYAATSQLRGGDELNWNNSIFRLLAPITDPSSLAMYVVPSFRGCRTLAEVWSESRLSRAHHSKQKWARHKHRPMISMR